LGGDPALKIFLKPYGNRYDRQRKKVNKKVIKERK
jgi:hypothetical protein